MGISFGKTESDDEFREGIIQINSRGKGSYQLVEIQDIFKKPYLTPTESSSASEDLSDPCQCKCHKLRENPDTSKMNPEESCCRCDRPKITEPTRNCSCRCHMEFEPSKKCCICRKPIKIFNAPPDNVSEAAPSERSTGDSNENNSNQSPTEETKRDSSDHDQLETSSLASAASENKTYFSKFTGWIFKATPEEESQSNDGDDEFEEISLDLPEPSQCIEYTKNSSWWDFQMITIWVSNTVEEAPSSPYDNPNKQAQPEEILPCSAC